MVRLQIQYVAPRRGGIGGERSLGINRAGCGDMETMVDDRHRKAEELSNAMTLGGARWH